MLAEERAYRFGKRKLEAKLNSKQPTLKIKMQKFTQRKAERNGVHIYQSITLTKGEHLVSRERQRTHLSFWIHRLLRFTKGVKMFKATLVL